MLALLIIPVSTRAGIFSLIFEDSPKGTKEASYNSQNIQLLEATMIPGPEAFRGGGNIVIVEERALLPEVGPLGMTLEIDDEIPLSAQISFYVVREGDTISQIAEMFNVSTSTIRSANNLGAKETIQAEQILTIPPVSGITYTIKKGDTLGGVAKKYKGDVQKISIYNGLTEETKLTIGDEIFIPDGEILIVSSKKSSHSSTSRRRSNGKLRKAPAGYYIRPVKGRVTQRNHGPYGAIDVGAPIGTPIVAMADGVVIRVGSPKRWNGGFGGLVVLQHNNETQTWYAHTSKNIVSVGQQVKKGQIIAKVGSTGRSTGPHLHFEVRGIGSSGPIQNPNIY